RTRGVRDHDQDAGVRRSEPAVEALGGVRPDRVRQLRLGRHPARRDRGAGREPPVRPGQAGDAGAVRRVRRHPGERLDRGDADGRQPGQAVTLRHGAGSRTRLRWDDRPTVSRECGPMSPPTGPHQFARVPPPAGRPVTASPADLRRKAHARLAPLADPARSRHKPLSLLRMEARRLLEQFFDAEAAALTRAERDKLADELLSEERGLGAREELFRDAGVREVMLRGPGQVIVRKADGWTPTSVRFRDAEQLRQVLARHAEVGEPVAAGAPAAGGFDVWLGNGFRAVGVTPPEVLGAPPVVVFVRGERPAPAPSQPPAAPAAASQPAANPRPSDHGTGPARAPSGRLAPPADRPDPYA